MPQTKSTLLIAPTFFELELLRKQTPIAQLVEQGLQSEVCGFGVLGSGIGTMRLIQQFRPGRVLLCGIAGSLHDWLLPGQAVRFTRASLDGIGAGSSPGFLSATDMGWKMLPSLGSAVDERELCFDLPTAAVAGKLLLTVCSASTSAAEAEDRKNRFPDAEAEDMEGYAVAAACLSQHIRLEIVRGISNFAGDRDKSSWKVNEAIAAAAILAGQLLAKTNPT